MYVNNETDIISEAPTKFPTVNPTYPTGDPTNDPTTTAPSTKPTVNPTKDPTTEPTLEPSVIPSTNPTIEPTADPTVEPTNIPTTEPTLEPTAEPFSDGNDSVLQIDIGSVSVRLSVLDILLTSIAIFICCCCLFGGIFLQIHKRKQILKVQSESTREREYTIEPHVGSGSTEHASRDSEIDNILSADTVSDDAVDANETTNGGDDVTIGGDNALLFEKVTSGGVEAGQAAFTDSSGDEMEGYQEAKVTPKGYVDDDADDDGGVSPQQVIIKSIAGETTKDGWQTQAVSDDDAESELRTTDEIKNVLNVSDDNAHSSKIVLNIHS